MMQVYKNLHTLAASVHHRNSTLAKVPYQMLETTVKILYVAQLLPK